jgi:tRNA/tmRNA/rRNA uracil-C5-methylase (TrmA/RlmC/RlmD family)
MADPVEKNSTITVGQRLTLSITDIAFGGEGVARAHDFVVFVPFVLTGEEVEVEIAEVKKKFARAKLLVVVKPSPDRVTAQCRYFGDCGGCQYQHANYAAQLQIKHKQIVDLFRRIGGFAETVIEPAVPCPRPYGYRNRVMVRSQWDKFKKGLNIGFVRHDNRLVVDIEECKIAEPALNEELKKVRSNPPPKGGLKVVLRVAPEGWDVPRDSFFQNNFFLLPKLVEVVRERIRDGGARHLIDAYCGVGFFAVELADLVESCVGIEIDQMAIKSARRNAAQHQRKNGEFLMGDIAELLRAQLARFSAALTAIVLDPPRVGCSPAGIQLLRETKPAQIIYVSCHPATLARDLNVLCADEVYELKKVVPLDMFPQTQHIECAADLRAKSRP